DGRLRHHPRAHHLHAARRQGRRRPLHRRLGATAGALARGLGACDQDVTHRLADGNRLYDPPMKSLAVAALVVALASVAAVQPPPVEQLHFHHVHLNSVNPAAAAEYYPKPFAQSAAKTTFNGFEAVKTGSVYLLFSKVAAPPQNELT